MNVENSKEPELTNWLAAALTIIARDDDRSRYFRRRNAEIDRLERLVEGKSRSRQAMQLRRLAALLRTRNPNQQSEALVAGVNPSAAELRRYAVRPPERAASP